MDRIRLASLVVAALLSTAVSAAAFEDEEEEAGELDRPAAAQKHFLQKRQAGGYQARTQPEAAAPLQYEKYSTAVRQKRRLRGYSLSEATSYSPGVSPANVGIGGSNWQSLGPGNVGGRTRALVIDPNTPVASRTIYAAAAGGGIFKTTTGGASWNPIGDFLPNIAVNSLAMDPANSSILYAGTGEGFFNLDAQRGNGIYKTSNGGQSWQSMATTTANANFRYVNDIVVSSNNSQTVYAATSTGVFRSLDGGASWSQVYISSETGGCLDLAIRTDIGPADTVLVSCGNFSQGTIRRNTDAGGSGTWSPVLSETGMGRTSLAIAPSNQDILYALAASTVEGATRHGLHAVFRSIDGGATWTARVRNTDSTLRNTLLLTNPQFGAGCFGDPAPYHQGWYDNVIAVDPADFSVVWVGGIDTFRSDDGGANWGLASIWYLEPGATGYTHADHHALVFDPAYDGSNNQILYSGSDGGVQRTSNARTGSTLTNVCATNPGVSWKDLNNNFAATQFYDGVAYPSGQAYIAGAQDNGTQRGTQSGGNLWQRLLGGDGGYVAVDRSNTNVLFGEFTGLSLVKSTDGGTNFDDAVSGISENPGNFLFINPFAMDPANSQILWTGGYVLWRTVNSTGVWNQASLTTPGVGSVSAWAVSPQDSNYVVAGLSDGYIVRATSALSTNSGTTWPSAQPVSGYISSLAYDPANKNIVYATVSSFGANHVLKSTTAGASWAAIDNFGAENGIPDIPAHSVVVDPDNSSRILVGTDLGVFVTTDGGTNWMTENDGLANVIVEKLFINKIGNAKTLFAFTHGRGAFKVALTDTATGDTDPNAFSFTAQTAVATGSPRTSNTVTISGLGTAAPVHVTSGAYSVGCNGSFTSADGSIDNGQTVCVRHTSALETLTTTTTALTIGSVTGSFSSTTGTADTSPDAFAFATQTDVLPSVAITSSPVVITGLGAAAPISIVNGSFSVACTGTFRSTPSTITNGKTVCVRHTSAATPYSPVTSTVTIGGVQATFSSLTGPAPDFTPATFSFTPQTDVSLNSQRTSDAALITGVNVPTPISVIGGSYSIGCGAAYTTAAGSIRNNQTVCVRHISSARGLTAVTTTLTVGTASAGFTSTTANLTTDNVPDDFYFTPRLGVIPGALVVSEAITVTGINVSVPISVLNGEYSVGCGTRFTTVPATIAFGAKVCVRHVESGTPGIGGTTTTLNIGSKSAEFFSSAGVPLTNGVTVNPGAFLGGDELRYILQVPSGATGVRIEISGGTGDVDLYTRLGAEPNTQGQFDCRPYIGGNEEICQLAPGQAGTYYIMLRGFQSYSEGVTLTARYYSATIPASTAIAGNGIAVSGLAAGEERRFTYTVAAGTPGVFIDRSVASGKLASMYIKLGAPATLASYDCGVEGISLSPCVFPAGKSGVYHILLRGISASADVTLSTTETPTMGSPAPIVEAPHN